MQVNMISRSLILNVYSDVYFLHSLDYESRQEGRAVNEGQSISTLVAFI